ncbi:MAG: hypothetical protein KDI79_12420 [Anaerolineae bacterium]|nr:hypothetical protein [Anaerolineae bacterium]
MGEQQSLSVDNVQLRVEGDITGQVAIGSYIIQIGSVHGGVVNVRMPDQEPKIQLRPTPIDLRPRAFPGLLGRDSEVNKAVASLQARQPVEVFGRVGVGKTALLRQLAYQPVASIFPHGVIYISAYQKSYPDLVQYIYDIFYETQPPVKASESQLRYALQSQQALILLDDLALSSRELDQLLNLAPGCTFIWSSSERCLWGEGDSIAVGGLAAEPALRLIEWELKQTLPDNERTAASQLCGTLKGNPLQILQAVALALDEGHSLAAIADQLQKVEPAAVLSKQVIKSLSSAEREILSFVGVLRGAPLHERHLATLTQISNLTDLLKRLQQRRVLQAHSPRYTLTGAIGTTLQQTQDLTPYAERMLIYFTEWAEAHQNEPTQLSDDLDAMQQILAWAIETKRWPEALRLAKVLESALALDKRWEAWRKTLQWALLAAQALGTQQAIAWSMHQLGTLSLCLQETETAQTFLNNALRIRESLGDELGAIVTRHHLNLIAPPPPLPPSEPSPPSDPPPPSEPVAMVTPSVVPTLLKIAALVLVSTLVIGGGVAFADPLREVITGFINPVATPVAAIPTATPTETPTASPSPTSTATVTRSPTSTPTHTPIPRKVDVITLPPTPTPEPEIGSISFAPIRTNGEIGATSALFKEGIMEIQASFEHSNLVAGTRWGQILYCNDQPVFAAQEEWLGNEPNPITIRLKNTEDEGRPLPPGECLFDIYMGSGVIPMSSASFTILNKPVIGPISFTESAVANPSNSFIEGISEIYAAFDYEGLSSEFDLELIWYQDGQAVAGKSPQAWEGPEAGTLRELLSNREVPLSPGTWALEIYVDDELASSDTFSIEPKVVDPCILGVPVGTVFNDFESPTAWRFGDHSYSSSFAEQVRSPNRAGLAGQLTYQIPANQGNNNFVDIEWNCLLAGAPSSISAQVYGDGSGNFFNVWITDNEGERWQFPFGPMTHQGWQQMTAYLDVTQDWPAGLAGEEKNGQIDYPVRFSALVLDVPEAAAGGSGTIYIDNLTSGSQDRPAEKVSKPEPAVQIEPTKEPEVITPSEPTNVGVFYADPKTIKRGECTTLYAEASGIHSARFEGKKIKDPTFEGPKDSTQACPSDSTTYIFRVTHNNGEVQTLEYFVRVEQPVVVISIPPPPKNIKTLRDGDNLTVSWPPSSGATYYKISTALCLWNPNEFTGGYYWSNVKTYEVSGTSRTFQDTPGCSGTRPGSGIRACNSSGCSAGAKWVDGVYVE